MFFLVWIALNVSPLETHLTFSVSSTKWRDPNFLLQTMMLNDRIQSLRGLQSSLRKAEEYLMGIPQDTPYSEFNHRWLLYYFSLSYSPCYTTANGIIPYNVIHDLNTGSKSSVWRRVGVTAQSVCLTPSTCFLTFLRPLIRPTWRSSLELFQWCSMLLSCLRMDTLPNPMCWDTLILVVR